MMEEKCLFVCVCVVYRKKENGRERDSSSQGGKINTWWSPLLKKSSQLVTGE